MREPVIEEKLSVYRAMYRMNLSFSHIVAHCRALHKVGMLTRKYAHLYESYTQELRAEINQAVVEMLEGVESDDMFRFGKARIAYEKELRDPDDVFIEAEERRRELARQAKRAKAKAKKRNATRSIAAPQKRKADHP